jgi:hypothetical protein
MQGAVPRRRNAEPTNAREAHSEKRRRSILDIGLSLRSGREQTTLAVVIRLRRGRIAGRSRFRSAGSISASCGRRPA